MHPQKNEPEPFQVNWITKTFAALYSELFFFSIFIYPSAYSKQILENMITISIDEKPGHFVFINVTFSVLRRKNTVNNEWKTALCKSKSLTPLFCQSISVTSMGVRQLRWFQRLNAISLSLFSLIMFIWYFWSYFMWLSSDTQQDKPINARFETSKHKTLTNYRSKIPAIVNCFSLFDVKILLTMIL